VKGGRNKDARILWEGVQKKTMAKTLVPGQESGLKLSGFLSENYDLKNDIFLEGVTHAGTEQRKTTHLSLC
jgi:hypothetical protein